MMGKGESSRRRRSKAAGPLRAATESLRHDTLPGRHSGEVQPIIFMAGTPKG